MRGDSSVKTRAEQAMAKLKFAALLECTGSQSAVVRFSAYARQPWTHGPEAGVGDASVNGYVAAAGRAAHDPSILLQEVPCFEAAPMSQFGMRPKRTIRDDAVSVEACSAAPSTKMAF